MEILKENKKLFMVTGIITMTLFFTILIISLFSNSANKSSLLPSCENHE